MKKNMKKLKQIVTTLLFIIMVVVGMYFKNEEENHVGNIIKDNKISYKISNIPEYSGEIYVEINNNNPEFTAEDMKMEEDYYSELENKKVRNGNDKNLLGKSK